MLLVFRSYGRRKLTYVEKLFAASAVCRLSVLVACSKSTNDELFVASADWLLSGGIFDNPSKLWHCFPSMLGVTSDASISMKQELEQFSLLVVVQRALKYALPQTDFLDRM